MPQESPVGTGTAAVRRLVENLDSNDHAFVPDIGHEIYHELREHHRMAEYADPVDRQTKLRGQRTEPAESEHTALQLDRVRQRAIVPLLHSVVAAGLPLVTATNAERGLRTPLSPVQEFFRAGQAAAPEGNAHNCLMAWWIDGRLNHAALSAATGDLHHRHEALHAAYLPADALSGPFANPSAGHAAPEVRRLPKSPDEQAAHAALVAALREPLDPGTGRNWRTVTVQNAATGREMLGIAVHHIAFDGGSESVLARELSHCYAARLAGLEPSFPNPAPTLAQLADDRRAELSLVDRAARHAHRAEVLRGIPELPVVPPRPDERTVQPTRAHTYRLNPATWSTVAGRARQLRATPFTVLLHAYAEALRTVTACSDFGIGVPIVRRGTALRTESLGCFIDMVPLRLRTEEGAALPFDVVRRAVADALADQDVLFVDVTGLAGRPSAARTPLPWSMFALQNHARADLELPGCRAEFRHLPRQHSAFGLTTEVWPRPDGSALIEVTHRADLVSASFVEAVVREFIARLPLPAHPPFPTIPDRRRAKR
ncbi:hypothetical protein KNE206_57090 [Kitasatospora sp. NE20-6]|uniref:condensation domain-containing protein n=1 Tax=Kitasatospora sp. NE20-6 TaxID=2859066 RepID=UPI0034DC65DC